MLPSDLKGGSRELGINLPFAYGVYLNLCVLLRRLVNVLNDCVLLSFILLRIMGRLQRLVHACQSQMVLVRILLRLIEISFR